MFGIKALDCYTTKNGANGFRILCRYLNLSNIFHPEIVDLFHAIFENPHKNQQLDEKPIKTAILLVEGGHRYVGV